MEAVEATPPLGRFQSHRSAHLGSPSPSQCYGLCEVTMTQEFPANEAPACAYTVGKEKLSVLPKKDLSSDPPPLPGNDLTQMNTEYFALQSSLPINASHHMTLCFCLSWGDGLCLSNHQVLPVLPPNLSCPSRPTLSSLALVLIIGGPGSGHTSQ